jgi:DNA-binding transcriptional ArsR family regulator
MCDECNLIEGMSVLPQKESIERLLWWLIAGTKGGGTRAMVIAALKEMPRNANQLAGDLKLDYKTIRHHLKLLANNRIVSCTGEGYGTTYFLTSELNENYQLFERIWEKLGKNKKSRAGGV